MNLLAVQCLLPLQSMHFALDHMVVVVCSVMYDKLCFLQCMGFSYLFMIVE